MPILSQNGGSAVVGTREDLSDILSLISPTTTPFQQLCKKGKITNTIYSWQTDSLTAAGANAAVEGAAAPSYTAVLSVLQKNYSQILTKSVQTSGTVDVTTKAGRNREMAYQVSKGMKELKRDIEFALTQNTQAVASTGVGGVAGKFKGLEGWIFDNTVGGSGYVAGSPEANGGLGSAGTAGTPAAFTEANLNAVFQKCYISGGEPDIVMLTPGNRNTFSGFDGVSNSQQVSVGEGKIVGTMKIYENDFGTVKVITNRFQKPATVFVLDSTDFTLATLRPLEALDLGKTGDFDSKQLITEIGFKVDNWHKHGAVRETTATT